MASATMTLTLKLRALELEGLKNVRIFHNLFSIILTYRFTTGAHCRFHPHTLVTAYTYPII